VRCLGGVSAGVGPWDAALKSLIVDPEAPL
jgi:hypothetical protein